MAGDRFEKNARTFTLLTLCSRATGLLRDATLARAFGVGAVMDAFAFGFMVPNLFRRLFGEGALSAAFLPVYARLVKEDPKRAARLASLTLVVMAISLNAVVLALELVLLAVHANTPPIEIASTGNAVSVGGMLVMPVSLRLGQLGLELLMVMLPYMPLVCMVAVIGSVLQTHDRFGPTAASPVILNLTIVAVAIGMLPVFSGGDVLAQGRHATLVGASVVVAGILQLAWSVFVARRLGLTLRLADLRDRDAWGSLRLVLAGAFPMMLGLGVLQINTFLDGLLASWPTIVGPTIFGIPFPLGEGAMAVLGNAQRLYEFPLGVFGIAIASAIFPVLARSADDSSAFMSTLRRGLRLVVFIGVPASVGLMLIARPVVAVILEGGRFTVEDTERVAFVLLGYAPAIWSYSMVHVLTRAFYALGDTKTPTRIALGMVGLNLCLNVALIFTPLREAGLAWSTAVCSVIQCAIMLRSLKRRVGPIIDGEVARSWGATAAATAVMGVAMWVVITMFFPRAHETWSGAVRELIVLMVIGGAVYLGLVWTRRRPELRWALGRK